MVSIQVRGEEKKMRIKEKTRKALHSENHNYKFNYFSPFSGKLNRSKIITMIL